ncbi:hypothetical protein FRC11_011982, partial [Ceratobasidium sp. 423]
MYNTWKQPAAHDTVKLREILDDGSSMTQATIDLYRHVLTPLRAYSSILIATYPLWHGSPEAPPAAR